MAEGGFAFAFREGALVAALRAGDWVLLDEINLAPSEVPLLPALLVGSLVMETSAAGGLPG